jgi:hypothetical protein
MNDCILTVTSVSLLNFSVFNSRLISEQISYCVYQFTWICVKWKHIVTEATIKLFMIHTIVHYHLVRKIIKNLEDYPVLKFRNFSFSGVEMYCQINLTVVSRCVELLHLQASTLFSYSWLPRLNSAQRPAVLFVVNSPAVLFVVSRPVVLFVVESPAVLFVFNTQPFHAKVTIH